ncbi:MAG: alpha/beta hydrolase [Actinomycetota bacterium]|nr:alpha/beta hydrolase [Actinomycetota bacterium]
MTDTVQSQGQRGGVGEKIDRTAGGLFRLERAALTDGPGSGTSVLLVHGSMDRATSFRRVMRYLPEMTVITYDRRGYAGSVGVAPSDDFAVQADDLVKILDGRRVVALGHSLGGDVALAAAQHRPDLVEAAVVYEPPQPWRPWWPTASASHHAGDPGAVAEAFMRRVVGDRVWQALPEATRQRRREEGMALQSEMRALHHGVPFDAAIIEVPVVVACGSEGSAHHRRSAPALASELADGRLVQVDGAGHGVHLSHPEQLADLVRVAITGPQGRP